MSAERLVSTSPLRERIAELRTEIEEQRKVRADDDPFFKHADWLLHEWEAAIHAAERQYIGTTEAARLTGWHEQTLRERGRDVLEGRPLPAGWEGLLARRDGGEWAFCLSSIPVKGQVAA